MLNLPRRSWCPDRQQRAAMDRARCSLPTGNIAGDPRRAQCVAMRLSADALACIVSQASAGDRVGVLRARNGANVALVLADGSELIFGMHDSDAVVDYVVCSDKSAFAATCTARLESRIDGAPLVSASRPHVIGQAVESVPRQIVAFDDAECAHPNTTFKKRRTAKECILYTPTVKRTTISTPRRMPRSATSVRTQARPHVHAPSRIAGNGRAPQASRAIAPSESGMSMSPVHCPFDDAADTPSPQCKKAISVERGAPLALSSSDRNRAALVEQLAERFREYDGHDRWVTARLAVFCRLQNDLRGADSDEARRSAVFRVTVEEKRLASDAEYARRIEDLEAAYAAVVLLQRRLAARP